MSLATGPAKKEDFVFWYLVNFGLLLFFRFGTFIHTLVINPINMVIVLHLTKKRHTEQAKFVFIQSAQIPKFFWRLVDGCRFNSASTIKFFGNGLGEVFQKNI